MGILLLTSMTLIVVTIVIHGVGTTYWLRHLTRQYVGAGGRFSLRRRLWTIIMTAILLVCLHFVEILLWALTYLLVAPGELADIAEALYFSSVTFTTLGYGDITLSSEWRLLSGFEAISGILLVGWTTAFMFAVLQKTWTDSHSLHNIATGDKNNG